jgi:hypothetical protein
VERKDVYRSWMRRNTQKLSPPTIFQVFFAYTRFLSSSNCSTLFTHR